MQAWAALAGDNNSYRLHLEDASRYTLVVGDNSQLGNTGDGETVAHLYALIASNKRGSGYIAAGVDTLCSEAARSRKADEMRADGGSQRIDAG